MFYLDTSLVVAALTAEEASAVAQAWLAENAATGLLVSAWVDTEFSAALSVKLRSGDLDLATREEALTTYAELCLGPFGRAEIDAGHFEQAARLADNHDTGLRGADALHLAIASRERASLCTLDKRQAEAGKALGMETHLLRAGE